jgi:hypothetical protein
MWLPFAKVEGIEFLGGLVADSSLAEQSSTP